jgi:hypothetical protein
LSTRRKDDKRKRKPYRFGFEGLDNIDSIGDFLGDELLRVSRGLTSKRREEEEQKGK